jgi:isocitrate/isopropylmalate dehydrogenase
MKLNIAVLPGDGIGPEIAAQGVEVMSAVCNSDMKSVMNMLFAGPMLSTRWEILFRKKHMRFVKERMPFFSLL